MTALPDIPGDPAPIDIKRLREIAQRFADHNRFRESRLLDRLTTAHRRIVNVLPILYHQNHPALPGFVRTSTPCGLPGFKPRPAHVAAAQSIARSFEQTRLVESSARLDALFVMGSAGSIGYSAHSDLDIWVCCDSRLHRDLMPKVQIIEHWAARQGMALQTFLVDPRHVLESRLVTTDTPILLLDEFYRSAIHMAGSTPLWWLVPPEENDCYDAYVARLLHDKFVNATEVIDFGAITHYPEEEVFVGGLRELKRALATPFKSLLKFMLIRSYARTPQLPGLAMNYKQLIYDGITDPHALDTYIMLYEHLAASFVAEQTPARQAIARELLVRKIARGNPRMATNRDARDVLALWGVAASRLAELQNPGDWRFGELLAETQLVNAELRRALDFLKRLDARRPAPSSELAGLGEQLDQMTRSHEPQLNLAIAPERLTTRLALERQPDGWCVRDAAEPVYRARSLVSVVAWAHRNRLGRGNLTGVHDDKLRHLFWVTDSVASPCRAFVNIEHEPDIESLDHDHALVSDWDDPLNYSGRGYNLIATIDLQTGRRVRQFRGPDALPDAMLAAVTAGNATSWHCIGRHRQVSIELRLQALYHHLSEQIEQSPDAHHLYALGGTIRCLCPCDVVGDTARVASLTALAFDDADDLYGHLSVPGTTVTIDPASRVLRDLRALVDASRAQPSLTLTAGSAHGETGLTLINEDGWFRFDVPARPFPELSSALAIFLGHQQRRNPARDRVSLFADIEGQAVRMSPRNVHDAARFRLAVIESVPGLFTVHCGHRTWPDTRLEDAVLDAVIATVLQHRAEHERYPIYLSDLDLAGTTRLADLLALKTRLEARLWRRLTG